LADRANVPVFNRLLEMGADVEKENSMNIFDIFALNK